MIKASEKTKQYIAYDHVGAEDYDFYIRMMFDHGFKFEILAEAY